MQSLSESRGGSKVTKPIFSNNRKRYWWSVTCIANNSLKPLSVNSNGILIVYEYDLYKKTCAKLT